MQYAGRVLDIEDHPSRKLIIRFYAVQTYLEQNKTLPVFARIYYELKGKSLEPDTAIAELIIS